MTLSNIIAHLKSYTLILLCCAVAFSGCTSSRSASTPASETADDRGALFDQLLEKTLEREAFSPVKNATLGLDLETTLPTYRDAFINASSDEALFYALIRFSNARKDRHLSVSEVDQGIRLSHWNQQGQAPIRFAADFESPTALFVFVSEVPESLGDYAPGVEVSVGDQLVAINQMPFEEYAASVRPLMRYSTEGGFKWKFAQQISERDIHLPARFYREDVTYTLRRTDESTYDVTLPYLEEEETGSDAGPPTRSYDGFTLVKDLHTFDLHRHETTSTLLLDWYGFREHLVEDIDWLATYAKENNLLDHDLIFDATKSRGGSRGAYAIQHLSPKPFKTTFGNLRISDITQAFIDEKKAEFEAQNVNDSGVAETIDDGSWLMDWLLNDVQSAIDNGDAYSTNVPFKLAHAPKDSDGILQPAETHFTGRLVCLLGPHGGSHLDQFASIVKDNNLGHIIGMPAGGYSNTWEWEETLYMPGSNRPLVNYMWSIGHTIRPNGDILEGNPAEVDEFVPQTRANYKTYHSDLVQLALEYLENR